MDRRIDRYIPKQQLPCIDFNRIIPCMSCNDMGQCSLSHSRRATQQYNFEFGPIIVGLLFLFWIVAITAAVRRSSRLSKYTRIPTLYPLEDPSVSLLKGGNGMESRNRMNIDDVNSRNAKIDWDMFEDGWRWKDYLIAQEISEFGWIISHRP